MPLSVHAATPDRFILVAPGQAARLVFAGSGLTYGPDGFPVSGTLDSLRLDGFAADLGTGASHVEVIRLGGLDIATLAGFDWFASADPAGDPLDPTPLLALAPGVVLVGTDLLNGGTGDDRLMLTATTFSGHAYGHDGDDWLRSNRAESQLYGGDGDDTLIAAADFGDLYGGGNDLYGGDGNDLIHYIHSSASFHTASGGNGNDTLIGGNGFEGLAGDAGDDLIRTGDNEYDVGEWGSGGDGNDTLIGGTGRQFLYGGNDDDRLFGGDGFDPLIGLGGRDVLFGGVGTDIFYFSAEAGLAQFDPDAGATELAIVADFATAEDRFLLNSLDNLTADESFDSFLAHARQAGANTVYNDPSGYRVVIRDLQLAELTAAHFVDDL